MKIIKYISFAMMFLLNLVVLYFYLRLLYIYYIGGASKIMADSRFEHAQEIYTAYQAFVVIICCLVLFFSAKKIKSAPHISFILLTLPVLYFTTEIVIQEIKWHMYFIEQKKIQSTKVD